MEILFSNVEPTQPEEAPRPEPEEDALLDEAPLEEVSPEEPAAPPARPLGPRPSVLKVSAHSRPSSVAGAIAGVIRELGRAEVQSIGAGATNQAVKAIAIARSYLQDDGIDIVCIPGFAEVIIEEDERTAIRLVVERRG